MAPPFPERLAGAVPLNAEELVRILTLRGSYSENRTKRRDEIMTLLGPDGRAWLIQTFDEQLVEETEPILFGRTKAQLIVEMEADRCLLCKCAVFAIDLDMTGNFCVTCVQDLVFLGHDINQLARTLRAGGRYPWL